MSQTPRRPEDLAEAAARAAERNRVGLANPEPSLAVRLGQIGVLGWVIVVPVLMLLAVGRVLDRWLATGIFFTAPAIMIGACLGMWMAWRWMHRS